jgi:hypothetical protein
MKAILFPNFLFGRQIQQKSLLLSNYNAREEKNLDDKSRFITL